MEVIISDLYCQECNAKFDENSEFDFHLSNVHGEKIETKKEHEICKIKEEPLEIKSSLIGFSQSLKQLKKKI